MLKITKSSDPIEVSNICMTIYANPGVGKTSMAFTADRALLLDFDRGSYRSGNRGDVVQVETWADIMGISADDLKPYKTVAIDTAGRALDALTSHILRTNPKAGNKVGGLSLQGYGELKTIFTTWTKLIRSFGLDVVLLSHSDEQKDGDDIRERLDIQGGSKNEIYKASDCMGRIYLRNGKRTLNFSPTDTAFGKNPAQLPPLEVPDFATTPDFLAKVIADTKASLNKMSAASTEAASTQAEWRDKINACADLDEFDEMIEPIKALDTSVRDTLKRLLVKAAKAKGYSFDKAAGHFVAQQAA
jgi:hypothetical protein